MGIAIQIQEDVSPEEAWRLLNSKFPDHADALSDLICDNFTPKTAASLVFVITGSHGWSLLIERAAQYLAQGKLSKIAA